MKIYFLKKTARFVTYLLAASIVSMATIYAQSSSNPYCFNFRWIDINSGGTIYTNGFTIPFSIHNNINSYSPTSLPPCPELCVCQYNFEDFPYSCVNAANTWNAVGSLPFLQTIGFVSGGDVLSASDDVNVIGFAANGEFSNTSILGFCRPYISLSAYNCDDPNALPNQPFLLQHGFDIAINSSKYFDVLNGCEATDLDNEMFDFESLILHEFGHALGLCHHPDAYPDADAMAGPLYNAQIRRTLSNKDKEALKALYPLVPPYLPCTAFTKNQGDDVGRKRGSNTGGGGGSNCHYIPPGTFSVEATRQMTLFWERELGNNFNLLMRRFVQNTDVLNHILTAPDSRFAGVQTAFSNVLTTLTPLIERNFAQNDSTKITAAHINAVCCWVEEMLPLFNEVAFYREPLFLHELLNLQKGLNSLLHKDVRTALLHYDNIANFSGLGACSCSAGKRGNEEMGLSVYMYNNGEQGFRIFLEQDANLAYYLYNMNGLLVSVLDAGYVTAGIHTTTITQGTLTPGLYVAAPVINKAPQLNKSVKLTVWK
ncbi:hypothetical protein C7N43_30035 [Sphingobacteriales bacterium UPWRP_1]|nr:hypothetical protein B6N25_17085 [Sphingobacteriales bacterium TSM_CSS]PSJ73247.1 hypothetical protein C7N43_30035 [Sphingobacteriales bacterium UPWRP_1]